MLLLLRDVGCCVLRGVCCVLRVVCLLFVCCLLLLLFAVCWVCVAVWCLLLIVRCNLSAGLYVLPVVRCSLLVAR